ncbi:MAG: 30S ribosomal protein S28e [Candidatus Diapherotrites archaeon]|nr:30S ribosomal protein S28e [Candidatus Diapherotrites archaeon]
MSEAVPAEVTKVLTRTGVFGEIHQVLVKVLDGYNKGRLIRRNVKGRIQVGDKILLMESEIEAREIKQR